MLCQATCLHLTSSSEHLELGMISSLRSKCLTSPVDRKELIANSNFGLWFQICDYDIYAVFEVSFK